MLPKDEPISDRADGAVVRDLQSTVYRKARVARDPEHGVPLGGGEVCSEDDARTLPFNEDWRRVGVRCVGRIRSSCAQVSLVGMKDFDGPWTKFTGLSISC